MITKSDIIVLEKWAKSTRFPLKREGITSKYMKYDPSVCYVKFGKNKKIYRDKFITNEVKNIIEDDKIYRSCCNVLKQCFCFTVFVWKSDNCFLYENESAV